MDSIVKVLATRPSKLGPDYSLLQSIHMRSRDLVFSMILDRENNPVLFGHIQNPRLKAFLSSNREVSGFITDFEKDPAAFMKNSRNKSFKAKRWGQFACRGLGFNNYRLFLLFLDKSLKKDIFLLNLAAAAYAIFFIFMSVLIVKRSIPRSVRKIRRSAGGTEFETNDAYGRKQVVDEQIEQLSFFREVALATNTMTELDAMMKTILSIFKMRFPDREIVFYLSQPPDDAMLPMHGLVGGGTLGREELETAGYAKESIDGLVREMDQEGEKNRTLVPLKDDESYLGFIVMKGPGPDENGLRDMHGVSKQIAMAVKNSVLYQQAITDGLTGLHDHRYFQLKLDEEIRRFQRHERPFSLILMDIDDFKAVNDTHGHPAGDYVLNSLAVLLKNALRQSDLAFRYGGEEFAVILVETDLTSAFQTAERIRTAVSSNSFMFQEKVLHLSLSLGVSAARTGETKEQLVGRCDAALYRAKQEGKDRVVIGE